MIVLRLILILSLAGLHSVAANASLRFNEANQAYSEGRFEEAVTAYLSLLEAEQSANLHFNLANAYYRTGNNGHAILHYQKALAIEPGHSSAKANLSFIRGRHEIPAPEPWLLEQMAGLIAPGTWTWAVALFFWLMLGFATIPFLLGYRSSRSLKLAWVCASGLLVAISGYWIRADQFDAAVILKDATPLRIAPTPESPSSVKLQAGTIVQTSETHQSFLLAETLGGTPSKGWVKSNELGYIWDGHQ